MRGRFPRGELAHGSCRASPPALTVSAGEFVRRMRRAGIHGRVPRVGLGLLKHIWSKGRRDDFRAGGGLAVGPREFFFAIDDFRVRGLVRWTALQAVSSNDFRARGALQKSGESRAAERKRMFCTGERYIPQLERVLPGGHAGELPPRRGNDAYGGGGDFSARGEEAAYVKKTPKT